jgi:hypothetical protein
MRRIPGIFLLVALLAMGAASSVASASPAFTAGQYPATITGSSALGNEVIATEGGSIECKGSYHADLQKASATLLLAPSYSECKAFGFASATVTNSGCGYQLHLGEETSEDNFKASFDVFCEAGKSIKVVAGNCEMEIGPQEGLDSVSLVNKTLASPDDIAFDPEVTGITYKVTEDGFLCPFGGTGSKTGATFTAWEPITLAATGTYLDIG